VLDLALRSLGVMAVILTSGACAQSSGSVGSSEAGANDAARGDVGIYDSGDSDSAAGDNNTCILGGGLWRCPNGNGYAAPQCPAGTDQAVACAFDGGCFFCREGAGNNCGCEGDGGGGTAWQCIGAGYACAP
jgi:hypothetical protein